MADFGSLGKFFVGIGVDLNELRAGMQGASREMSRANGEIKRQADGIVASIGSITKATAGIALGMAGLQGLESAFQNTAVAGFKFNASMEQSKIAFSSMLGSAEEADKMLKKLYDFAASTPFEFPELVNGAKKMLAMGFSAEKIMPTLKSVGDAAAGLGLSGKEGIDRIVRALGQMQMKGKVSAEEMQQLAEAGIPAWDILAKAMGKSTAEVMKLSEKGLIPAKFAVDSLVDGMGKRFPDMMAAQSKSFNGMLSTLKDNMAQTFGQIMKPTFEYFANTLMPKATAALEKFNTALNSGGLSAAFKTMFPAGVVDAFTTSLDGCGRALTVIADNMDRITPVLVGLTAMWTLNTAALVAGKIAILAHIIAMSFQSNAIVVATQGTFAYTASLVAARAGMVATAFAAGGLGAAFRALLGVMMINPVILVLSAIAALAYVCYQNWDKIVVWCRQAWTSFLNWIADSLPILGNKIRNALSFKIKVDKTDIGESMDAGLGRNRSRSDYNDAGLGNKDGSTVTTTTVENPETPDPAGMGEGAGGGKSAFQVAEELYNHEVKMADMSAAERLATYREFVSGVEMTTDELRKYQETIYDLEKAADTEKVEARKVNLERMKLDTTKTYDEILAEELSIAQAETALHAEGTIDYERAKLKELEIAQRVNNDKLEKSKVALEMLKLDTTKTNEEILLEEMKLAQKQTANTRQGSIEFEQAKLKEAQIAKQIADEKKRLADEVAAHERKLRQMELDGQVQKAEQLNSMGIKTDRELLEVKRNTLAERERLEIAAIKSQLDSGKLSADAEAALKRQLVEKERGFALERQEIEHKLLLDTHRYSLQAYDVIKNGFGDVVNGMLMGTMSFRQGINGILTGIRGIFAKMAGDMVRDWVTSQMKKTALYKMFTAQEMATHTATETAKQTLTQTGVGVAVAAESTKAGASIAASAAGASASVAATTFSFGALWKAMLSTAKAILSIPVIGWIIGGAMIMGIVNAMRGASENTENVQRLTTQSMSSAKVPSYDVGSWDIPKDHLAQVHKGEIIVSEPFANKARALFSGEGSGQAQNVSVNYTVTAMDGKDVKRVLKEHGRVIVDVIKEQNRNFAFAR